MNGTATGRPGIVAHRAVLVLVLCVTVLASLLALRAAPPSPLFDLGNLVGPTTQSLLRGGGLTACTEGMGTPGNPICFHSARMPMASLVVALGIKLLGDRPLWVDLFKTIFFLIPLQAAIWLLWRHAPPSKGKRILAIALWLAPFGMTAFLADVVNLQVEEGYGYSLLALAVAILLFHCGQVDRRSSAWALLFAVSVAGLYLVKSSMLPAVIVLVVTYAALERNLPSRILVVALVSLTLAGWATHQRHASGRYTVGTSLDGLNLHKGNNQYFLDYYPPAPGETIDAKDAQLNRGLRFIDEWSFNDFHQHEALEFIEAHPRASWQAFLRKLRVFFFSASKSGSAATRGRVMLLETVGLVIFRIILWAAILGALHGAIFTRQTLEQRSSEHATCIFFLALVAALAFPYLLGFAYTRHVSVLIYPSVLMCCRLLEERNEPGMRRQ